MSTPPPGFDPPTRTGIAAGWHPDPYQRFEVRYYNGTDWTDDVAVAGAQSKDPDGPRVPTAAPAAAAPPAKKKGGGTVLKVLLGMVLGVVVLIAGCAALIGGAANEVQKESDRTAITLAEYQSVKTGQITQAELEARFGEPSSADEFQSEIEGLDQPVGSTCVYYNREGEFASIFQFCFDINTKKLESKFSF